jgi:hypothetical protein
MLAISRASHNSLSVALNRSIGHTAMESKACVASNVAVVLQIDTNGQPQIVASKVSRFRITLAFLRQRMPTTLLLRFVTNHRNELKLGNLASGYKIAQKALNRFSLAVWGIRQRYPYPGSN